MSRWYAEASVSTLKCTVCPTLTLIVAANPWMVGSPIPSMLHTDSGVPGRLFSQAIGLATGAAQGPPSAAAERTVSGTIKSGSSAAALAHIADRRCRNVSLLRLRGDEADKPCMVFGGAQPLCL